MDVNSQGTQDMEVILNNAAEVKKKDEITEEGSERDLTLLALKMEEVHGHKPKIEESLDVGKEKE